MTEHHECKPDQPDAAAPARRTLSTRYLLACAAIGAAGGLIVAPVSLVASGGPALAFPLIYAALLPVKLVPGLLAQMLLRRPGAALLTSLIVGLVNIPFSAHGPAAALALVAIGLMQEIPPAVWLYRRWSTWLLAAGSASIALALAWLGWRVISVESTVDWMRLTYWPAAALGALAITWLCAAITAGVRRSGALDSLEEEAEPTAA